MSIKCMTAVWEHSRAKEGSLLLLLAIADCARDPDWVAWPLQSTLSEKTRMSERGVRYCQKSLQELGELEVDVRSGPSSQPDHRPNLYRIKIDRQYLPLDGSDRQLATVRPAIGDSPTGSPLPIEPSLTVIEPSVLPGVALPFQGTLDQGSPVPHENGSSLGRPNTWRRGRDLYHGLLNLGMPRDCVTESQCRRIATQFDVDNMLTTFSVNRSTVLMAQRPMGYLLAIVKGNGKTAQPRIVLEPKEYERDGKRFVMEGGVEYRVY